MVVPYKIKYKTISVLNKIDSKVKNYNISDTIIIAGSPRSGTTFLAELFEKNKDYRVIFEPLHPFWNPEIIKMNLKSREYMDSNINNNDLYLYFKKVLSGKVASNKEILDFFSDLNSKINVIKFVRANRILPWIFENFPIKIVFLMIRHPCATISSQIKSNIYGYNKIHFNDSPPTIKEITDELMSFDKLPRSILDKLKNFDSIEERLAISWCLDYYIPLSYSNDYPIYIVPYEKLLMDGEDYIKNVFSHLNLNKNIHYNINKPSKVASNDFSNNTNIQLNKWKYHLTEKQINNIVKILKIFKIDFYSYENSEIDEDQLYKFGNY